MYDLSGKRVFVAGHRGMVGGALLRRLQRERCDLLTVGRERLDLLDQAAVRSFMFEARPDAVIVAAAKVGGIQANSTFPAEFLYENLAIEMNVIHAAFRAGVEKLVFLGSSCIYPKFAPQPIREDALLSGPLEPTNDCYAVAKIAGLKLCEAYRSQYGADFIAVMLTNLYGPGDNFHLDTSHVIPALLRKAHEAKISGAATVSIWGSGTPRREFLHVDDASDAIVHLLTTYSGAQHVNIGSGEDITILDLMKLICRVVGFEGKIVADPSKPDGTPRKRLDVSRLSARGWKPRKRLKQGLAETYAWYMQNIEGMLQRA
ncbi:GDP-L-fucose synthase family protein [Hyphomicrobium sp. 2TAF46]